MKKILISGGSGMVGRALTELLQEHGYRVCWLTRRKDPAIAIEQYEWDWERGTIDEEALSGISAVVHLAGASLNQRRWNRSYKQIIYNSRVKATAFLVDTMRNSQHKPDVLISASAAGCYGHLISDHTFTENDPCGNDFLARTCFDWEQEALRAKELGIRTVMLRTGVVISHKGGALPEMLKIFRLGLGAVIGSGKQYFSWIHLKDVCNSILHALEHAGLQGPLNLTAPGHITNAEFTRALASSLGKKVILPPVPGIFLKALYGEVAESLLGGSRISPKKLIDSGYQFSFADIESAL